MDYQAESKTKIQKVVKCVYVCVLSEFWICNTFYLLEKF